MQKCTQTLIAIGGGMVLSLVGCQSKMDLSNPYARSRNTPPESLNNEPLVVDEAMQLRDWERATALYANGDTAAGPTGFPFQPVTNRPEWQYALLETPLFVFQTVALPVTLAITPPWTEVHYAGATVEPTYTAMPPLPPSNAVVEMATPAPEPAAPESMPTTTP